MKRVWLPLVGAAALLAACHDETTTPIPNLTPSGPSLAASSDISSQNAFQQCANGNPQVATCDYINSVLNASKSQYSEGQVIAQKLAINNATIGDIHTLVISYGFQKSSSVTNANYDFQARYDATLGAARANPCLDQSSTMTPFCTGTSIKSTLVPKTFLFPRPTSSNTSFVATDPNLVKLQAAFDRFTMVQQLPAELVIYNGNFNLPSGTAAISNVSYQVNSSDIEATVTYKFVAEKSDVLLLWGMHFASEIDWKNNGLPIINGASGQSGSPFHVKLLSMDGASVGQKALNVSGDVVRAAAIGIKKAPDADPVNVGSPIGFTITVSNTGDAAATGVTVTDLLPPDFAWSVAAAGTTIVGCTIDPTTKQLSCPPFTLAVGSIATPTIATVHVTAPTTSTTPCGLVSNPKASVTTTNDGSADASSQLFINCPGLSIVKTTNGMDNNAAPGPFIPVGSAVTWTYLVKNTGNVTLTNVTVTDDKLAASAISCTSAPGGSNVIASLAVGASATCAASGTAAAGQYTNTGKATSGSTTATDPDNYFGAAPGLSIVKKTNGTDNNSGTGPLVRIGDPVTWTYDVKNTGNVTLTNVTVTDDKVAASAISCTGTPGGSNVIASLAASATLTCTASGTATAGQYTNTGKASDGTTTVTDIDHYYGADPSITINKTTNGADGSTIPVGSAVAWRYLVKNTGNVTLTSVTVTDDKVAASAISCTGTPGGSNVIESLAAGASATCAASGTAVAGSYENTGTVVGTPPVGGNVTANDPSSYFGAAPGLSIVKKTNGTDNNEGTGPLVRVGDPVTWTYDVKNTGNVTLTNVTVTDDKVAASAISCTSTPGGSNVIASLAAGATATCTASGTATAGQYTNTGKATDGTTTTTDVDNYFGVNPSITILKKTNGLETGAQVTVGDVVTWTYDVKNTGNVTLTNVTVTDNKLAASAISCTSTPGGSNVIASLAAGATAACAATGTATAGAYINTGTVSGKPPVGTDVTANDLSDYNGLAPLLAVVKSTSTGTVSAGDPINFKIDVTNNGPGIARSVSLTDALPTGTDIVWSVSPAVTGCSVTGSTLTCSFGDLAAGASKSVTVTSPTTKNSCGTLTNPKATATPTNGGAAESGPASVTINCAALVVIKTADQGTVQVGTIIGFTMSVKNNGAGTASGVVLTDQLPATSGLAWQITSSTPALVNSVAPCSIAGSLLTCNFGSLAPQATASVHISSPTTSASCGIINNTANATSTNDGSGSNSASVTVECPQERGLIAPTQTTCEQFAGGNNISEPFIKVGVKANKVNNVAPGVIFYYVDLLTKSGPITINVLQTTQALAGGPWIPIGVNNGQAYLYRVTGTGSSASCSVVTTLSATTQPSLTYNLGSTPARYVIGIKFQPGDMVGTALPNNAPSPVAKYTWSTKINGVTSPLTTRSIDVNK